jgi:hypothetical protein
MKTNVKLLAGFAALAMVTPSFAVDVEIRLTGSTAMRSQVHAVLTNATDATPAGLGYSTVAATSASSGVSGASYHIYELGTSPNKTTIKTSWSGSVAGIQAVAQNRTDLKWLPNSAIGNGTAQSSTVAVVEAVPADIAFSDVWQDSSPFTSPRLTDVICGVVQFRFVTSTGSPITNITPQQIRTLYLNGSLPLSSFTGNAADTTKVYALGRDPDSGTRVTAFVENGLGPNPTVLQYKPVAASGTTSALAPYAATTKFGISLIAGNDGESSGGTLAGFFRNSNTSVSVSGAAAAPCHFIGYLGTSDAATAIATASGGQNPGSIIAFNGSNPAAGTALADAIKNGSYHFWSYLHCMNNGLTGDKAAFYTTLSNTLKDTPSSNIALSEMNVERSNDGADITPK